MLCPFFSSLIFNRTLLFEQRTCTALKHEYTSPTVFADELPSRITRKVASAPNCKVEPSDDLSALGFVCPSDLTLFPGYPDYSDQSSEECNKGLHLKSQPHIRNLERLNAQFGV